MLHRESGQQQSVADAAGSAGAELQGLAGTSVPLLRSWQNRWHSPEWLKRHKQALAVGAAYFPGLGQRGAPWEPTKFSAGSSD